MRHSPLHTLLFLASVFGIMGGISLIYPEKGLVLNDKLALSFPTWNSFFNEKKTEKVDISKIIALADAEDKRTGMLIDSVEPKQDSINEIFFRPLGDTSGIKAGVTETVVINPDPPVVSLITNIQYKNSQKTALHNFFSSLQNLSSESKSIRVLHYGDSQIEGDRISDYLRLKLQMQFGGDGPGLVSVMPVAPSVINKISWSETWDRYCVFAYKDKRVPHSNYGVMAQFSRFKDYKSADTMTKNAWIKIQTTRNGGAKAASYNKVKLFYGGAKSKALCEFYDNGIFKESDSLVKGGSFNVKEYAVSSLSHEFKFIAKDSPEIYGVSLEGCKGVMVDNMGLRGSSGTFFNQISSAQLKQFYEYLNVRLIILQFGGNSLPYTKDKEMADNFGLYLRSQIVTLKKIAPKASILVIGPADMSVKEGTEYVTHPLLEDLRNAIRDAAFSTDCAFFDMYDCMGGKNSMVAWVEQGIAAKDYIHFSPAGARKIATLLYSSLINDYNAYKNNKKD
jgi:lysophospholipase L1-like esterase